MSILVKRLRDEGSVEPGPAAPLLVYFLSLGIAIVCLAAVCERAFGFSRYSVVVAFCYALVAGSIAIVALKHLESRAFGAANQVTMLRVGLAILIAGLLFEEPGRGVAWLVVTLAVISLVLDGVDGKLARYFGQESTFGARFDMETDAALILILAIFSWQLDKAGSWIVAAGLMRYVFVAAAHVLDFMRRPLPSSRRRQTLCVVQIVGLLLMISPLVASPVSKLIGAITLALLAASFATDVIWLLAARQQNHSRQGA